MLLTVTERGPENGSDIRPPVVFLHGLFGRGRNFGFLQRDLARTRRTLALDLRNHGTSPHGPATYQAMAEDVRETLMALGISRAVLIGHSMGGKTAMMLALLAPEMVAGLLVADIAPGQSPAAGMRGLVEGLSALPMPGTLSLSSAHQWLAPVVPDKPVRDLIIGNLAMDPGQPPRWRSGLTEIHEGLDEIMGWPALPASLRYDGPVLFIAGSRSTYISPADYPAMKHLFPNYRLEQLPDAGHWVHAEKPREFLAMTEQFLNSL